MPLNKLLTFITFCFILFVTGSCSSPVPSPEKAGFTNHNKPWARWWWMGNAVTKEGITTQLEAFSQAGFGGVSIIPIYGVKGEEESFIPYLSALWMQMLDHTLQEAARVGMEVDMTLGTGWPYGGPWVEDAYAARKYDPAVPEGVLTQQKVKRNAPGGEGWVVDPFSKTALQDFLHPFDSAWEAYGKPLPVRAIFNDSYEVFGANWTPKFYEEFESRRGYALQPYEAIIFEDKTDTLAARVLSDYHKTIAELLYDNFTLPLAEWCHAHNIMLRNEAHGSPGNLLDLYAAADIPETEIFRSSHLDIPGVRIDEGHDPALDKPNLLMMKFASSAAHVAGKPLVSSETATWLGNHFKVALSQVKPEVDQLFTAGINHIIYHGITYSPPDAPWPGWLFYASTHFGPTSHFWQHLPLLNHYITRCQQLLQNSQPSNDVLLYFPIYDLWSQPGTVNHTHPLRVHNVDEWLLHQPTGEVATYLSENGYGFDYISDLQLESLTVSDGNLLGEASQYKVIVVPACEYMPLSTLEKLVEISQQGGKVLFQDHLPTEVPGLQAYEQRKAQLHQLIDGLQIQPMEVTQQLSRAANNEIYIAPHIADGLAHLNILPEEMVTQGLSFIRKTAEGNDLYFIANLKNQFREGAITLNTSKKHLKIYDPLHERAGTLKTEPVNEQQVRCYLQLLPGQSCFILASDEPFSDPEWEYVLPTGKSISLNASWDFSFGHGVPEVQGSYPLDSLASWTTLEVPAAKVFSGTGIYQTAFDLPDEMLSKDMLLNLGEVREVAEVVLNGQPIDTLWSVPYQVEIPQGVLKRKNELTVKVTNVSANRIAQMDREGIAWKKFYDINIVDISYQPFDASGWAPVPSGLLGPVTLQAVERNVRL